MDKLKMHSTNKVDENIEKIGKLFPNCITERKNESGETEYAVDFDMLRQELSSVVVEGREERYQFTWPDKKKAVLTANAPINKTLRPCREESVDFDNTENLYIEGDNLEVLKLLQETYLGKIKMIYIDPPYNTGKDSFVYDDDFGKSNKEFEEQSGMYDENGNILFDLRTNNESNGRFHTDWLNMIYPRLKLAKDLLTDDGVICVQIDDNEYSNLKKVCDEIFGAENFMTTIAVKMSEPTGMKMAHASVRLPKLKEYILVYKRGKDTIINSVQIPKDRWDSEYKTFLDGITQNEISFVKSVRDNEDRTISDIKRVDDILSKVTYRSVVELYKEKNLQTDEEKTSFNYDNAWRIVQTVSMTGGAKLLADEKRSVTQQTFYSIQTPQKKMYIIKGDYSTDIEKPRIKILFADDYLTVNPCDFWQDIKTTGLDNEGFVDFRNGKKPMKLVERVIKLFSSDGDYIMDFFSGSGTTGNAVLEFCQKEQQTRKFILVQLPENIDEQIKKADSSVKKDLHKTIEFLDSINKPHCITEIGKERIRRAGKKIVEEQAHLLGAARSGALDSQQAFAEFTTSAEAKERQEAVRSGLDIGFRVLKLDESNMKEVYYTPADTEVSMFDTLSDNIKEDRTAEDLLFQVMLDLGVLLSSKIEETEICGKKVFTVADGFLMACFDKDVGEDTITEVAKQKPYYFVMRDSGFRNDSVAVNFEQIFNAYSPDTVRKVL